MSPAPEAVQPPVAAARGDLARSIKRTLEVLEYFDETHPAVSVGEISRELGYPQSSTSILMKSLLTLGYLSYDEPTRTYRPTARVALLGRGIRPQLFGDGSLLAAMHDISARTGDLVLLAARAGLSIQYIHVVEATNPLRMHLRAGATRALIGSSTGHLFLSDESDEEIARLHGRAQAIPRADPGPSLDEVMREVRQIRRADHVLSTRTATTGGGVIGVLLPREIDDQRLAVCVGGVGSILVARRDQILRVMRAAIDRHILASHRRSA